MHLQREVLVRAIEEGYFPIPRGTTLVDLAADFDISDQAVSECLRRALRNLTQATVLRDRLASSSRSTHRPMVGTP